MPGFWDYLKQTADSMNQKANTLFERQMGLAQMMAGQEQNKRSDMLALQQLKLSNLGQQSGLENSALDREQDVWKTNVNAGISREQMATEKYISDSSNASSERINAANRKHDEAMAIIEYNLQRGLIDYEQAKIARQKAAAQLLLDEQELAINREKSGKTGLLGAVGNWFASPTNEWTLGQDKPLKSPGPASQETGDVEYLQNGFGTKFKKIWYKDGSYYIKRISDSDWIGE